MATLNMTKKLLFLTGTRADFGKLKSLIHSVEATTEFEAAVFITGMHTLTRYGYTVDEVYRSLSEHRLKDGTRSVYVYHKNYFSLCKQDYYSCPNEISGVVGSFFKTPYIQICSELFSAPEQWLIDNKFNRYVKPKKIKKIETKTEK